MTKLYVGNLPFSMADESLLQLFTEKGYKAASARIITERETGRSRGFGFVELGPGDDAAKAIGELNGMNIEGRALQRNEARVDCCHSFEKLAENLKRRHAEELGESI